MEEEAVVIRCIRAQRGKERDKGKTLLFSPQDTIQDIEAALEASTPHTDFQTHSLFHPRRGAWLLHPEELVEDADVRSGDDLWVLPRSLIVRIEAFVSIKTMRADPAAPLADTLSAYAASVKLHHPFEYGLVLENDTRDANEQLSQNNWLDLSAPLLPQCDTRGGEGVLCGKPITLLLRKRVFWAHDGLAGSDSGRRFAFHELESEVRGGKYALTPREAGMLGAFKASIIHGPAPLAGTNAERLPQAFETYLPQSARSDDTLRIMREVYLAVRESPEPVLRSRYVALATTLPGYGTSLFYTSHNQVPSFGIHKDGIVVNDTLIPLPAIRSWTVLPTGLELIINSSSTPLSTSSTSSTTSELFLPTATPAPASFLLHTYAHLLAIAPTPPYDPNLLGFVAETSSGSSDISPAHDPTLIPSTLPVIDPSALGDGNADATEPDVDVGQGAKRVSRMVPATGMAVFALQVWLTIVAAAALFATSQGYMNLETVKRKQFSLAVEQVSPLAGRLWAVWTLLAATVRLATAYDPSNPTLFVVCIATFLIAGGFYGAELLVYKTIPSQNALAPAIVSSFSTVWMLFLYLSWFS